MSKNMKPMGDRILVKPKQAEQKSEGGILLPGDASNDSPAWGEVVKTGPGVMLDNGQIRENGVSEGDTIIFAKYAGTKIKVDGEELLFIRAEDVMAVAE